MKRRARHPGVGGDEQLDRSRRPRGRSRPDAVRARPRAPPPPSPARPSSAATRSSRRSRGLGAGTGQLVRKLRDAGSSLGDPRLELGGHLLGVLQPLDLGRQRCACASTASIAAAVLALQAVDQVEALLDRLKPRRLRLDRVGEPAKLARELAELERRPAARSAIPSSSLSKPATAHRAPDWASARPAAAPPPSSSPPLTAACAPGRAARSPSALRSRSRSAASSAPRPGRGSRRRPPGARSAAGRDRARAPPRARGGRPTPLRGPTTPRARCGAPPPPRWSAPAKPSSTSSCAEDRVSLRCSCCP